VDKLSPQRIKHELDLILEEPNKAQILARMAELGLLKPIHAVLPWDETVQMRFQVERAPELIEGRDDERSTAWLLWLLALSKKQIESIDKRLHFTSQFVKTLLAASKLFSELTLFVGLKASKCVEYLDEVPLLAVYAVFLSALKGEAKHKLEKYLTDWRHVRSHITGRDLEKRGLQPGPIYNKILHELRNAWLDQEVQDIEAEKKLLEDTLREF
jgi:tRNA nucleotidyltransferase (CCA-adding enzyme)